MGLRYYEYFNSYSAWTVFIRHNPRVIRDKHSNNFNPLEVVCAFFMCLVIAVYYGVNNVLFVCSDYRPMVKMRCLHSVVVNPNNKVCYPMLYHVYRIVGIRNKFRAILILDC